MRHGRYEMPFVFGAMLAINVASAFEVIAYKSSVADAVLGWLFAFVLSFPDSEQKDLGK